MRCWLGSGLVPHLRTLARLNGDWEARETRRDQRAWKRVSVARWLCSARFLRGEGVMMRVRVSVGKLRACSAFFAEREWFRCGGRMSCLFWVDRIVTDGLFELWKQTCIANCRQVINVFRVSLNLLSLLEHTKHKRYWIMVVSFLW